MDIQTITAFFMWCTIINGGLLVFWGIFLMFTPDLVYRLQVNWFPIPREQYNIIMYSFLGAFKIVYLMFNVAPFVALLIIT